MPLRVTKEYATDHENGKKVHKKMSKSGHYQKVRRPTDLEVYNDAANILEELLQKRIDRDGKVARQRRNRTDPTKERESVCIVDDDVPVIRRKTMPSRYHQAIDDENKKNETEDVEKRKQRKKMKNGMIVGDDTDSSANDTGDDSDLEDKDITKNRKKKSLFKRAKENLIRTFQRDQKDGFGKRDRDDKESDPVKRKHKKKPASVVSESKRSVRGRLNEDQSIDFTEVTDYRRTDPSSNTEIQSHKQRSGSINRNSLMDTLRKPFRKSVHKNGNLDDDEKSKINLEKERKALSIDDDGSINVYPTPQPNFVVSPRPPTSISVQDGTRRESSLSPSSPNQQTSPSSELPTARGGTLSSTASTHYPTSDYNNSVGSLNALASVRSHILDSPGEDIEFIDGESDKDKRKSLIKYHGSEGLLNLQWLAQTANAKAVDFEIDEHCVSTRRADGQLETVTTVTATKTVVLPEVQEEEEDTLDGAERGGDKPDIMKDELYGKIAQKLIEMADTYGADMSDAEGRGADAVSDAAIGDGPLTDLEKEIIACLRAGGDKYDKKLEEQLVALKSAVSDDAYDRFRSTVENSMGHELSWNTIALLFYATKGVVSAVGKSSKVATQAKEFTLKYISDTFVSWIMEQGGFDSMLSGSESNSDLD